MSSRPTQHGQNPFGRLVRVLVRTTSFVGKELTEVRRQPRLILSLVLGPFLILFLFGLGYAATPQDIRTVVVLPADTALEQDLSSLGATLTRPFVLVGMTHDADAARQRLADGTIDAVLYVPDQADKTVLNGQRAILLTDYNEIDPLNSNWINYYAYVQTSELNKRILIEVLRQQNNENGAQKSGQATKQLAEEIGAEAGALRASIAANDTQGVLTHSTVIRQKNASARQQLLTAAQVFGGIALFTGLPEPQNTPQGKALEAAQGATTRIDEQVNQVQAGALAGRLGPDADTQAAQIQTDAATLATSSDQLKVIPPEVLVSPFEPQSHNLAPLEPDFVQFYAPAVIALLLQHIAVTLTALTLVRERLLGSVEVYRVSPISPWEITLGKYAGYALLTTVLGALLTVAMHLGLGIPLLGGYLLFAGAAVALVVASISLGFLISAFSNSESQAVQLSMLVLLASVFFSGFFLPLTSLVSWVRSVSYILPVTYGIAALRPIMLRGVVPPYWTLAALGGMTVVLFTVSTLIFRRQFRRG